MNTEFVVKTSVAKTIFYSFGCLLFVVGGIFIYLDKGWLAKIIGIISVGFFGFGFFVLLYRGLDRRPRIVIDEKGITDRTLGVGRIDWEDIKFVNFQSDSHASNNSIFLKLVKSEKNSKVLANLSKGLSKFDGDLDFGILHLNLNVIDKKPEEIYAKILNHISEKRNSDSNSWYEDLDRIGEIQ
jgi:hypothetical protein